MLSAAKHLEAHADRPFAAAQGDMGTHPVMLSATKHLEAHADRPFAAAQGDTVRQPAAAIHSEIIPNGIKASPRALSVPSGWENLYKYCILHKTGVHQRVVPFSATSSTDGADRRAGQDGSKITSHETNAEEWPAMEAQQIMFTSSSLKRARDR